MTAAAGGRRLWVAVPVAVLGLGLIGLAQGIPNRHAIQDNLTRRSQAALEAAGLSGVQVSFTGRDGSLVVPASSDVDRARDVVADVEGVRVVSARGPETPPRAPVVTVTVDAGTMTVAGQVPSEAARARLVGALGGRVQDRVTVGEVSDTHLDGFPAVVRALDPASQATIELRDGRITLTGTVPSSTVHDAAVRAASAAVGAANVVDRLEVAAPPEVIQRELSELPQITFEFDSATLTAAGQAAVADAADILRANPNVRVRIEGHTDGNGTAQANLVLSRARAQTVLDALVALGIDAGRLSAEGFGETRHKVPDTSAENQAINRRVEFVVLS